MQSAKKIVSGETYEHYRYREELLRREEEKRRQAEKKLVEKQTKRIGRFLKGLVLCGFVFTALAGMIFKYAALYEAQYDVNNLKSEIAQEKMIIEEVKSTLDSTVSLDNVERVAMTELNMQYPKPEQIVYIKGNWHYSLNPVTTAVGTKVAEKPENQENLGGAVYDYILKLAFGGNNATKAK